MGTFETAAVVVLGVGVLLLLVRLGSGAGRDDGRTSAPVVRADEDGWTRFAPGDCPWPRKPRQVIADHVNVAGISKYQKTARAFMKGDELSITLAPEPTNTHDRNAIQVVVKWRDRSGTRKQGVVGYLPREVAADVARRAEREDVVLMARIRAVFTAKPDDGLDAGMRIDVALA